MVPDSRSEKLLSQLMAQGEAYIRMDTGNFGALDESELRKLGLQMSAKGQAHTYPRSGRFSGFLASRKLVDRGVDQGLTRYWLANSMASSRMGRSHRGWSSDPSRLVIVPGSWTCVL